MISRVSYPNPVLGNPGDYEEEASFTFKSFTWFIEDDGVSLEVPLPSINDQKLNGYFQNNEASLYLKIISPSSYFSKIIELRYDEFIEGFCKITFPIGELNKKIFFSFYLATNQTLTLEPELLSTNFPSSFPALKNDIIAKSPKWSELIDHEWDPKKSNSVSFMAVTFHIDEKEKETSVDFGRDRIMIQLPKSSYDEYILFGESKADIIHSGIVFPVLIQAVNYVINSENNSSDEFSEKTWFQRLNQLIFDQSQELENLTPLEIAQKILKDPMKRGISYLTISDKDAESEEDY